VQFTAAAGRTPNATGKALIRKKNRKFKKGEVKVTLCLINYALCHENTWGSGGIAPPFVTSALDGGQ
jgi:hypothetical protein